VSNVRRTWFALLLALLAGSLWARGPAPLGTITLDQLPPEARATLALIRAGGPFPYDRDGIVFSNRERQLPLRPRGYYREYTVPTPGRRDRGPRRIVAGQPSEYYWTTDHYRSFVRIRGAR
jgi:ribonuclease T1